MFGALRVGRNLRRAIINEARCGFAVRSMAKRPLATVNASSALRVTNVDYKQFSRGFQTSRAAMSVVTENLESLGDSITTAVIVSWSKEPGDSVKEDDVIAVVETDKVTMDIRAKKNGVFVEGLVPAKSEIAVGSALYKLDTSAQVAPVHSEATIPKTTAPAPAATPVAAAPAQETIVNVPVMGESISSGILATWHSKPGDVVKIDQVIASIETDKVTVDVRSPLNGVLTKAFAQQGDEVGVSNPIFAIVEGGAGAAATPVAAPTPKAAPASAPKQAAAPTPTPKPASTPASPAAKPAKTAEVKEAGAKGKGGAATDNLNLFQGERTETRVKMTRMRQRISVRLKEAQNTAAMLTTFQEVDMTRLVALRNQYKDDFEKNHGVKLGFMSAFVKASTFALQEVPAVNAVIDDATKEIVYRNYCDVSVAVASPNGLVVPVLRNTENMSFADVEKSIAMYGKKAKEGTLALEDMTGGTFTISNGGVFGSLFGTPIINPPQSAILGMHATKMRAVVIDGKVEARPMMYLALTYDHRLIDGREAVTFLKSIAGKIEDPGRMLLQV